jgi:NADPH:quinone reductase-like Zn-dependent oxidoreductase
MNAWVVPASNRRGELELHDVTSPEPGTGEVLVRVRAASLNPVDAKLVHGGHPDWRYPHVPGVDGAGVVEACGEGIDPGRVGQRVCFHHDLRRPGTFAELVCVAAHVAARLPDEVSFEAAAALPCAGGTALQALDRKMHVRAGQTVLIHGGSGGVGGFAVQIAKASGARVIATASPRNHAFVRDLGADQVLDYRDRELARHVLDLTAGLGVHALLDTVGAESATAAVPLLRFNGHLAFIAGAPDDHAVRHSRRALSCHEVALGGAYPAGDREAQEDLGRLCDELLALVAAGRLRDGVTRTLAFEDLPHGLHDLRESRARGKIVCTVP